MEMIMENLVAVISALVALAGAVAAVLQAFANISKSKKLKDAAATIQKVEAVAKTATQGIEELSSEIKEGLAFLKEGKIDEAMKKIPDLKNYMLKLSEELKTDTDLKEYLVSRGLSK